MTEQVHNITDALPAKNSSARLKARKGATIGMFALGALLLVDDQVQKFRERRSVKVVVTENPTPED